MLASSIETIGSGGVGLRQKTARMRQLIEKAKRDPSFRRTVGQVLDMVPGRDHDGEIYEVVEFVRDRVRYQRDPTHLELFQSPQVLLKDALANRAAGDCDDLVLLAGAMLEVVGHPIRLSVGALRPGVYSHIWLDVRAPGGWTPIELTRYTPVGWSPADRFPIVEHHEEAERQDARLNGGLMSIAYRTRPGGRVSMAEYYPPRESTYYKFLPSDIMREQAVDQLGEFEPDETWGWVYETEWVPDGMGGWGKKIRKRFKKIRKKLKKVAKRYGKRVAFGIPGLIAGGAWQKGYGKISWKKAFFGAAKVTGAVLTGGAGAGIFGGTVATSLATGRGMLSKVLGGGGAGEIFGEGGFVSQALSLPETLTGKVTGGFTDLFSVGAAPYQAVRSWMEEALPFAKGRIPGFEKIVPKFESALERGRGSIMDKWLGLSGFNGLSGLNNRQTLGLSGLGNRQTPRRYGSSTLAGMGDTLGVLPTGAARIFAPDFEYWVQEYADRIGLVPGQDQYKGREKKSPASKKWEAEHITAADSPILLQLKFWDDLFKEAGVKDAWDKVKNQPWSIVRQKMPPNAVDWYPANNAPWTRYWLQIVLGWYKVEAWSPGDQGVGRRVALMGPIINNLFAEFITAAGQLKKKPPPAGGAGAPPPPPPAGSSNQAKIDYLNKLLANLKAQLKAAAASAAAGAATLAEQIRQKIAAALAAKTNLLTTIPPTTVPGGTDQLRREMEQIKRDRAMMAAALLKLQKQQAARGAGAPGPVPEGGIFSKLGGAGGVGALAIGAAAILALFMRRK